MKPKLEKDGYQRVCLYDDEGNAKMYQLHRVVYEAFTCEPIPIGMQVNNIDECKTNNQKSNLNLMTCKENNNFGTRNARITKAKINGKRSKQVGAFKDGKIVLSFPSTREAGRNGFNQGHIASCCRGEIKSHKGYEWRYI